MLRITHVQARNHGTLLLRLSNGQQVERDVRPLLTGPAFTQLAASPQAFAACDAEFGTVVWTDGADLCPDVLIWGGPARDADMAPESVDLAVAV